VNELLTYGIMLDLLIVVCKQHMIMLIELQKVSKSGPEVFVYQVYHSPVGMNHTKNYGCESLIFLLHYKLYCTEMYLHCMYSMYILYRSVCLLVL